MATDIGHGHGKVGNESLCGFAQRVFETILVRVEPVAVIVAGQRALKLEQLIVEIRLFYSHVRSSSCPQSSSRSSRACAEPGG